MTMIADNLLRVRSRIAQAALACGRTPDSIVLLAVSKKFDADAVRQAFAAGQTAFGENYIQEGVDKIAALADLPLQWHCIGPIQSNKTRLVAEHFDWVHSVDRLKIAQRLSEQRPTTLPLLNVCIQVNIDAGPTKAGVAPEDALALAQAVVALPGPEHLAEMVHAIAQPGDCVICLGAGTITAWAAALPGPGKEASVVK